MCLVPGLADGRYLLSNELLPEELAVSVDCECDHRPSDAAVTRRQVMTRTGLGAAGLLAGSVLSPALAAAAAATPPPAPQAGGDRVVFLGVNGGPVLSAVHSQPSMGLIVNGDMYLIDCGGDSGRQLLNAGLHFASVRHIFLTHHHIDHTAGYPEFALLGWLHSGDRLTNGVQLWGPPPVKAMQSRVADSFALGIKLFEEIGTPAFAPIIEPRELVLPKNGVTKVMEDKNVRVHATRVYHGPEVHDAYAYRFDIKHSHKSVVFSGDTTPSKHLVRLAQDADLLVHEAQMNKNIPLVLAQVPPAQRAPLRRHLLNSHTNVIDVPGVAKASRAKRLSMCHYTLDPRPQDFLLAAKGAAAKIGYRGEIIAPTELDQIQI